MSEPPPSPYPWLDGLDPEALLGEGAGAEPEDPQMPEISGLVIERVIGRGGMGRVYLARQTALDRYVALKQVSPELAGDPELLRRLEREARIMARLRHPNIVAVHHFEQSLAGGAAIVMEYVEGGNLREKFREFAGPLPLTLARQWIAQIAAALVAAHAAGVVHRDMKPENVLIAPDGSARVTDFGLARPVENGAPRLTTPGVAFGTVDYMAPEVLEGVEADERGDVYAVGVIFYEMLTGEVPRGAFDPPRRLRPAVGRELSALVMGALRRDPAERFGSMAELLAELEGCASGGRRWPWVAGAVALAGLAVVAGALVISGLPAGRAERPVGLLAAEEVGGWRDALEGIDPLEAAISGGWQRDGAVLVSDGGVCILAVAQELPGAYDVRATFTRVSGDHSVAIFFRANGTHGSVDIDGWGTHVSGVQSVAGLDLRQTGGFACALENGRSYELLVEVRPQSVRVLLDGEQKGLVEIAGKSLGIVAPWGWDPRTRPAALAVGSYQSPTRFSKIQWRAAPAR